MNTISPELIMKMKDNYIENRKRMSFKEKRRDVKRRRIIRKDSNYQKLGK